jgi:GT2 family glycosyltransferase
MLAVIIVTHNSEEVLGPCLRALKAQSLPPARVLLVDSGSRDSAYLDRIDRAGNVVVLPRQDNIGFARANNVGCRHLDAETEYVLFLNPDVVLAADALHRAVESMQQNEMVGVVTGRLLGYDFPAARPTGLLDSTGIFREWFGRWYDRGQGEADRGQFAGPEDIPAACGALLFCRKTALDQGALAGGAVFDPDFFLYKEDIELCLRLRKQGWLIRYEPGIRAWHGRGWRQRGKMSLELRTAAARSEVILYRKHPSPYLFWALVKYLAVRLLKV